MDSKKEDQEIIYQYEPSDDEYNQNLKERIEEKKGAKVINYEELINIAPEFAKWLKSIIGDENVDSQALLLFDDKETDKDNFVCYIYTNDHCYSISGYRPKTKHQKNGYLGCMVSTRKNRVGEDWKRDADLPDGPYSKKTFDSIVKKIVAFELQDLELWR